jgi:hypothetical protein
MVGTISNIEDYTLLRTYVNNPPVKQDIPLSLIDGTTQLSILIKRYKDVCEHLLSASPKNPDPYDTIWNRKKFIGIVADAGLGAFVELFKKIIRTRFRLEDKNTYGKEITEKQIVSFCLLHKIIIVYIIVTQFTFADSANNQSYFPQLTVHKFLVSHDHTGTKLEHPMYINDVAKPLQQQHYYESTYNYFTNTPPYNMRIRYRTRLKADGSIIPFDDKGIFNYCIEKIQADNTSEIVLVIPFGINVSSDQKASYITSGPPLSELALSYVHLNLRNYEQKEDNTSFDKVICCQRKKLMSIRTLHTCKEEYINDELVLTPYNLSTNLEKVGITTDSMMGLVGDRYKGDRRHLAFIPSRPNCLWYNPKFAMLPPKICPDMKAEGDKAQGQSASDIKLMEFPKEKKHTDPEVLKLLKQLKTTFKKNPISTADKINHEYILYALQHSLYNTYKHNHDDKEPIGKHLHFSYVVYSTIDQMAAACGYDLDGVTTLLHHGNSLQCFIIKEHVVYESNKNSNENSEYVDSNENDSNENDSNENDSNENDSNENETLAENKMIPLPRLIGAKKEWKHMLKAFTEPIEYKVPVPGKYVPLQIPKQTDIQPKSEGFIQKVYNFFKFGSFKPDQMVGGAPPTTTPVSLLSSKPSREELIAMSNHHVLCNAFGPFSETIVINKCGDAVRYLKTYMMVTHKSINDPLHKDVLYSIYDDINDIMSNNGFNLPQLLYQYQQYLHVIKSRYIRQFINILQQLYKIKYQLSRSTQKSKSKAMSAPHRSTRIKQQSMRARSVSLTHKQSYYSILKSLAMIHDNYYGVSSFNVPSTTTSNKITIAAPVQVQKPVEVTTPNLVSKQIRPLVPHRTRLPSTTARQALRSKRHTGGTRKK